MLTNPHHDIVCVCDKAVNGSQHARQYQFNGTAFRTRKDLLVRGLERGIFKACGSQLSTTKTLSTVIMLISAQSAALGTCTMSHQDGTLIECSFAGMTQLQNGPKRCRGD